MKPYSSYKPSGIPWLAPIPAHWETKRAKRLFHKMERPPQHNDKVVTCFRDGAVTLRENRRTEGFTESLQEIGYQGIREGDLVVHNMDAFAGAIGVSDSDGKGTPVYSVCTMTPDANAHYYAATIREMARSQWVTALATGIRERSTDFRYATLAQQILPVPPPDEQAAIVRFLDHNDELINRYISAKERLIALLEEQRQAVIHQAVTRGLDPDVKMKDSHVEWLGEVPERWEVRRIKSLTAVKRGASPRPIDDSKYFSNCGEYAWVRIADVTASNHFLETTTQRLSKLGQSLSVQLEPGALFMSIAGSVGKPMITKIKCCIHDGFVYFPGLEGDQAFMYQILSTSFLFVGLGKFGTQLNLNTETVGGIRVPYPPIAERRQITAFLEDSSANFEKAISQAQHQIHLINEYRSRLIADVVTGQIDVRDAVAELPGQHL